MYRPVYMYMNMNVHVCPYKSVYNAAVPENTVSVELCYTYIYTRFIITNTNY